MRLIKSIKHMQRLMRQIHRQGQCVGFVPTMGYCHEGHLSLMRAARRACDVVVVSIYVNPKQFDRQEDLRHYPRDIARDTSMILKENVDILFIPSDNDIYPDGYLTYIDVEKITDTLCGAFRPGHFKGVATVVAKLLNIVQPDFMYLGQKDAQQVAVISKMAADLNFAVKIKMMPTTREPDGLAMSSRNVRLSAEERAQASVVYRALTEAQKRVTAGERSPLKVIQVVKKEIRKAAGARIEYVVCVDAETLVPLSVLKGKVLIAIAVYFGKTRLIDNVIILVKNAFKV